jgi:hypothetical protein
MGIVGEEMCLAFVDKNKLMQVTAIQTTISIPWYNTRLAPCPLLYYSSFKQNLLNPSIQQSLRHPRKTGGIYSEITDAKTTICGMELEAHML